MAAKFKLVGMRLRGGERGTLCLLRAVGFAGWLRRLAAYTWATKQNWLHRAPGLLKQIVAEESARSQVRADGLRACRCGSARSQGPAARQRNRGRVYGSAKFEGWSNVAARFDQNQYEIFNEQAHYA